MSSKPTAILKGKLRCGFLISPPRKPIEFQPSYAQKAASIAVKIALTVTGCAL